MVSLLTLPCLWGILHLLVCFYTKLDTPENGLIMIKRNVSWLKHVHGWGMVLPATPWVLVCFRWNRVARQPHYTETSRKISFLSCFFFSGYRPRNLFLVFTFHMASFFVSFYCIYSIEKAAFLAKWSRSATAGNSSINLKTVPDLVTEQIDIVIATNVSTSNNALWSNL